MKLKTLIDLFLQFYPALIDAETLLEGLKKTDPNILLAEKLTKIVQGLPPARETKTIKERIPEVEDQIKVIQGRVNSILNSMKEEIDKLLK